MSFISEYTTTFAVSPATKQLLTHYKYLKWNSRYFMQQWEANVGTYAAGTIHRYNQIFHVVFTNGVTIGKLKQLHDANADVQLALSFRKAPNQPAYVIVGLVGETNPVPAKKLHSIELAIEAE